MKQHKYDFRKYFAAISHVVNTYCSHLARVAVAVAETKREVARRLLDRGFVALGGQQLICVREGGKEVRTTIVDERAMVRISNVKLKISNDSHTRSHRSVSKAKTHTKTHAQTHQPLS
jgi:hypothetical protein